MENQTRFDLNAAVEKWRQEMAGQPNLTADDRQELETHLRDTIIDFQQRGLNDEESFWLARRRAGIPQELDQEFVKANPAKLLRERVFWLAFSILIYRLWNMLASSVISPFYAHRPVQVVNLLPEWVCFYFPSWLRELFYIPYLILFLDILNALLVMAALICVLRGKFRMLHSILEFIFKNRLRFILVAMLSVIAVSIASSLVWNSLTDAKFHRPYIGNILFSAYWSCWFISVVAWLIPSQNQSSSQLASIN